jgi:EAL domain-containing protein (putative c-di-GMP-specific phosphodiesterase class I)
VSLSINASPALILCPEFAAAPARPRLALDRLVIEVTEHALVTDYEAINAALRPLRERGVL